MLQAVMDQVWAETVNRAGILHQSSPSFAANQSLGFRTGRRVSLLADHS